jgi:hypothetical protein
MTRHIKRPAGSWWDLLFILPQEPSFSYKYVLKDSDGGVVWISPVVREYSSSSPSILDIITLEEFQSSNLAVGRGEQHVRAANAADKAIDAEFVFADPQDVVELSSYAGRPSGLFQWHEQQAGDRPRHKPPPDVQFLDTARRNKLFA